MIFLARPTEFEPLTFCLEMREIEVRNYIVLFIYNSYFIMCLRKWLKD